jgi:hypothetical protein
LSTPDSAVMRKIILFITTFWVVIYSNARMSEAVPTYKWVHLFPIPQPVRIFELLLVTFLYVLALTTKMTKKVLLVNLCILIYLGVSIFSAISNSGLTLSIIQEIYIRLVPFLFFVVIVQGKAITRSELLFVIKFFSIVLTINLLVAICYQIPFYGYYEDNINGLFEDAHLFGNVLAVFSLVFFYDFMKHKRKTSFFFSIGLLLISFFPSNEKVVFLNLVLIVVMLICYLIKQSRSLLKKIAVISSLLIAAILVLLYVQKKNGHELWLRADVLVNTFGIENIGPVKAWPMAFNEMTGSVTNFLYGVGPGQYGWIAAGRAVAEGKGSVHSKIFEFEFSSDNVNNAGFLFRTNTWSSLLAEYGAIGFIVFIVALLLIIRGIKKYKTEDRLEADVKMIIYIIFLLVIYQGFFTPYSNWSMSVLMFPAMFFAAYFHQRSKVFVLSGVNKESFS